jgi:RHS repeat-associated protein
MTDAADGSLAAMYEYTPFGELVAAEGPAANVNPFCFSTKYFDSETGLYYYGYRY